VTRTWPVSGKFSATQRALYEVVLEAQSAAIQAVRPGVRYAEVHRVAALSVVRGLVALGILKGDPVDLAARGAAACSSRTASDTCSASTCTTWKTSGTARATRRARSRSTRPGDRYLRLDRDLARAWPSPSSPATTDRAHPRARRGSR
jgi:hypothetical protein